MRFIWLCLVLCLGLSAHALKITQIVPFGTSSVRISFNKDFHPSAFKTIHLSPSKDLVEIKAQLLVPSKIYPFSHNTSIKISKHGKHLAKVFIKFHKHTPYQLKITNNHLYISLSNAPPTPSPPPPPPEPAPKRFKIVLDPGHGGRDCGAMGVSHVCEKHIVLHVAKYLQKELKERGYIVYMTRHNDHYIGLKERTEFANNKEADLFISIHANSIPKHSTSNPKGVETYFLSPARSERARKVAEQENQDDVRGMDYFSKMSFLNSLNSQRLVISNKLAIDIQFGILSLLRQHYQGVIDGGVREGPFWVLAGALMPSVLIEIGYNSNPKESKRLQDKTYQQFLAKGIANGIQSFFEKNY
ncbi:N-acetylmuramoyl-L-alanine amidase [Helicobacter bizzozeronii CIII-1]|uniref:N-acetylmuramoyl-L-alanine amidase n=4 Tax=Helicobacter bizzozeronii TaxID=56877 RepID=F8KS40_HELBC|nr:N-acetylmuramoyl-L-alanine amidase [Helicobacter bizzozeronii]CCB79590.1 N-acetylmuramoyl-L-alanine amidase [Helicobacter bizzozeronii CIII-1]